MSSILFLVLLVALVVVALAQEAAVEVTPEGGSVSDASSTASATTASAAADPAPAKKKPQKKKTQKSWSSTNFNELEKQWEAGDDPELLQHEFEYQREINQRKAGAGIDFNNPKKLSKMMKKNPFTLMGGTSTKMVFVDLKPTQLNGEPWDSKSTDKIAARWQAMMKSGSLAANVFNIGDGKLLVSVDKSYMFGDIMKYCLNQEEAEKVTIDSKEYFAKDYKDAEEEE